MSNKKYKLDEFKISINGVEMKPCKVESVNIGVDGFKVGDLVVENRVGSITDNVLKITSISKDGFEAVENGNRIYFKILKKWPISRYVRPATPKEIEQGYRDE